MSFEHHVALVGAREGAVEDDDGLVAPEARAVERQVRWSRVLLALGVTLILALLYDVPFEDLLLPPNGDV